MIGETVTEIDKDARKCQTIVYAFGKPLAYQRVTYQTNPTATVETVAWEIRDPSNTSIRGVGPYELDPDGMNVGTENPYTSQNSNFFSEPTENLTFYPMIGGGGSGSGNWGCRFEGINIPCGVAFGALHSGGAVPSWLGAAAQDPNSGFDWDDTGLGFARFSFYARPVEALKHFTGTYVFPVGDSGAATDGPPFEGGSPNLLAQITDCLALSVPTFGQINKKASQLLTNTYGADASSIYHSWSIYERATFLNTIVGASEFGVNFNTARITNKDGDVFLRSDKSSAYTMGKFLPFGVFVDGFSGITKPTKNGSLNSERRGKGPSLELEKMDDLFHFDFDLFTGVKHLFVELPFNKKRPTHPGDVRNRLHKQLGISTGVDCVNIIPDLTVRWFGNES